MSKIRLEPYYDRGRHTVLKVEDDGKQVKYIPLNVSEGLMVVTTTQDKFKADYKPIPNYPIAKAVDLFVGYAKTLGATKEVMQLLSTVVTITEDDIKLATNRHQVVNNLAQAKSKKPLVEPASCLPKQQSAAQMFKDLIMEGRLSDDEIFKQVQINFGIDDSKLSYVKKYRNGLIKEGKNPPAEVAPKAIKGISKPPKKGAERAKKIVETGVRIKSKPIVDGEFKSAAAMFQGLIMAGKLTDLEIFSAVKEKFGIGDEKKGYVKWYRYNLKRHGKNPPDEVVKK